MEESIVNTFNYPILTITTFLPLAGAALILFLRGRAMIRWTSLATAVLTLVFSLPLYRHFDKTTHEMQFVESQPWIPLWDITYKVGVDGISILFIILTTILTILCITVSWQSIQEKVKEFFVSLLIMETAMIGIFVSLNIFLFYLFWELMLIPMFLLIGVWGGANRIYAAIKFVLFTLAGSVFMLIGMIVLYFAGGRTFDIQLLHQMQYPVGLQVWLFLAFFSAFAVKVPMFPVHTWLPDAHTEAPTAGSVILAGVLLKMGAYGFLRFSFPLFPDATRIFIIPMLVLSAAAIIYGGYVTLMQKDLKRLIAYSSVSHMGFVTLGLFTLNRTGLEGGILQMINHGVVTGALFLCVGIIYERTHTRMIEDYGGLSKAVPRYTAFFALFTLAAIGFPGMNAFVGEFLIISGAFKAMTVFAVLSIVGIILGVTYMGWLYYRVVLNEVNPKIRGHLFDLNAREVFTLVPLAALVFYIGVQPEALLSYMHVSVAHLIEQTGGEWVAAGDFSMYDSVASLAEYVKRLFGWG